MRTTETIGIYGSLSNSSLYEQRYLENIKKLYQTTRKYANQHHCKAILEAAMISTPEGCINNSSMTPNQYLSTKKPSARKSLCQFSEILDVKHKTTISRSVATKENLKEIKTGNVFWPNVSNFRGHTKINQTIR